MIAGIHFLGGESTGWDEQGTFGMLQVLGARRRGSELLCGFLVYFHYEVGSWAYLGRGGVRLHFWD